MNTSEHTGRIKQSLNQRANWQVLNVSDMKWSTRKYMTWVTIMCLFLTALDSLFWFDSKTIRTSLSAPQLIPNRQLPEYTLGCHIIINPPPKKLNFSHIWLVRWVKTVSMGLISGHHSYTGKIKLCYWETVLNKKKISGGLKAQKNTSCRRSTIYPTKLKAQKNYSETWKFTFHPPVVCKLTQVVYTINSAMKLF